MRIGIDARFYGSRGKGIGRYTQKLLASLEKLDHDNEYYVFLRQENFDSRLPTPEGKANGGQVYQPQNPKFHKVLADYKWYSLKEQILFPFKLYAHNLDLVHFLHFNAPFLYKRKFVVTIHDLTHHYVSKDASTLPFILFYGKKILYFLVIRHAIKKAKKIITVSSFIKIEIIKRYKVGPEKIIITYESA